MAPSLPPDETRPDLHGNIGVVTDVEIVQHVLKGPEDQKKRPIGALWSKKNGPLIYVCELGASRMAAVAAGGCCRDVEGIYIFNTNRKETQ